MPRDASRLMVLRGDAIQHRTFADIAACFTAGDLLVLNETRVIAARVFGTRPTGGRIEVLLLRPSHGRYDPNASRWHVLAKPARKLLPGARIEFGELGSAAVVSVDPQEGIRELEFALNVPFEQFLERAGTLPLPPYIHNESAQAQERYQTIFAREPGSVAAPTASLHFTERVFERLTAKGVQMVKLVLDVGLGTFRPMQSERIDQHRMHSETFTIPESTAAAIAQAKREGRRVVAAGTTVVRALEGSAEKYGAVRSGPDETSLFIKPGFEFRVVDAMITNFHLPHSTLLVLVSTFAGRERILHAYQEAVRENYRFFSFGDAMFVERAT